MYLPGIAIGTKVDFPVFILRPKSSMYVARTAVITLSVIGCDSLIIRVSSAYGITPGGRQACCDMSGLALMRNLAKEFDARIKSNGDRESSCRRPLLCVKNRV